MTAPALNERAGVIALLSSLSLPVTDLPHSLDNFVVMKAGDEIIGIAGVEIYGHDGLLRSVAVHPSHRGCGIAGELVRRIEADATRKGLRALYLLTETAEAYFRKKLYRNIRREDVPATVRASSEFSHVCPQSAVVMVKFLNRR